MLIQPKLRHTPLFAAMLSFCIPSAYAAEEAATLPAVVVKSNASIAAARNVKNSSIGSKADTPLAEVPQSISVMGQKQLEAQNVQSINEALMYTAGIQTYGVDTRSDYYLTTRGFSSNFYLDHLRLPLGKPMASWRNDPYELERVEVLRGPASVLYGSGGVGGTINLVSKKPTADPINEVGIEFGNMGQKNLFTDLGLASIDGIWSSRLVAQVGTSEIQGNPANDERISLAPSFRWQPSNDTSLTLLLSYFKQDAASLSNFLPYEGTVTASKQGKIDRDTFLGDARYNNYDKEQHSIGYEFEHRFNETWAIRQHARYQHMEIDNRSVYGIGLADDLAKQYNPYLASIGYPPLPTDPDRRLMYRMVGHQQFNFDRFNLDTHAQARFDTPRMQHTLLIGLDLQQQNSEDPLQYGIDTTAATAPYPTPYDPYTNPDQPIDEALAFSSPLMKGKADAEQTLRQVGVYLQDQIKIDQQLVLTLSGRQDWVKSDYREKISKSDQDNKDQAFTGRAGVSYLLPYQLTPYVSYAQSFEPLTGSNGSDPATKQPFKPLEGQQWETGLKYLPAHGKHALQLAVFEITQQNVVSTDQATQINRQIGEQRSRGFELEGHLQVVPAWTLRAAYSYLDIETTKSDNPAEVGKRPVVSPRHTASVWNSYRFDKDQWQGRVELGVGARYVGETTANESNTLNAPSYTILDANMSYQLPHWRFSLTAKNLADKTYVSCGSDASCFYGNGRQVLASARYQW